MMRLFLYFLFFLNIFVEGKTNVAFANFQRQMENRVTVLANAMAALYTDQTRCSEKTINCQIKSYDFCKGTSQKWCNSQFPKYYNCDRQLSAYVSINSSIRFPLKPDYSPQYDDNVITFACASAQLQQQFEKFDIDRNSQFSFSYVAGPEGFFRLYPSGKHPQENGYCQDYDPRIRPWYNSATTGPKNIVLLIDISGNMRLGGLVTARSVAETLVETLGNVDFVSVIAFNSDTFPLVNNLITRATIVLKNQLIEEIKKLTATGTTNYTKAFTLAINQIKNANSDQYGTPCSNAENIIFFISDGQHTGQSSAQIINQINSVKQNDKIRIFTTNIGQNSNQTFLQSIACEYGGIMFNVRSDVTDVITLMEGYYQYITIGSNISRPIWSEPYDDAFGFGRLFTVSIPIYYSHQNFKRVIGVAGLDIIHEKMLSFSLTEQQIISELIDQTATNNCPESTFSQCEIQFFRSDNAKCNVQGCTTNYNISKCANQLRDYQIQPVDNNQLMCCPVDPTSAQQQSQYLWGIALGAIAIVAIVGIGCLKYKKKLCFSKKEAYKGSVQKIIQQSPQEPQVKLPSYDNSPITIQEIKFDDIYSMTEISLNKRQ